MWCFQIGTRGVATHCCRAHERVLLASLQLCVVVGTAIVGMATMVCKSKEDPAKNPAVGNLLVILAQIIVSVQMVVEEKFIGGYSVGPASRPIACPFVVALCLLPSLRLPTHRQRV
jgi:hypothetical protein